MKTGKNVQKTMKIGLISLTFTLAAFGHTSANPIELTKQYAFSQIRVGYLDHFHDMKKQGDFMFSVPALAFSRDVQLDPFIIVRDGEGLQQFGVTLPIFVSSRFMITPALFRDVEADQFGVAFNAVIRVR